MLLSHLLFGIHNTHSTISQTCSLWVFVTKSTEKRASGLNKFMFAKKKSVSENFKGVWLRRTLQRDVLMHKQKKCTLKLLVDGGVKKNCWTYWWIKFVFDFMWFFQYFECYFNGYVRNRITNVNTAFNTSDLFIFLSLL